MYEERIYRDGVRADDLTSFTVVVKETDLFILADSDLSNIALDTVINHRRQLEVYISHYPEFVRSLVPVPVITGAPDVVVRMADAANMAGVGPMAAVAGTFADLVGEALLAQSSQVIVENGGDIFIKTDRHRIVSIYAGDSPLSGKVALRIKPGGPFGMCTSSGRVGPSLSFGKAHAACVIAGSAALADAAASAVGNAVKSPDDIEAALDIAKGIKGVLGAVVIIDDRLGAWGQVELTGG